MKGHKPHKNPQTKISYHPNKIGENKFRTHKSRKQGGFHSLQLLYKNKT